MERFSGLPDVSREDAKNCETPGPRDWKTRRATANDPGAKAFDKNILDPRFEDIPRLIHLTDQGHTKAPR